MLICGRSPFDSRRSGRRRRSGHCNGSAGGVQNAVPPVKHFASSTSRNESLALSLGFTVMDIAGSKTTASGTKAVVDALPPGVQAMDWVGNLDNTSCTSCSSQRRC
jgi:hypothetical protein